MTDLGQESLHDGGATYAIVARMLRLNDWHLISAQALAAQVIARLRGDSGHAPPALPAGASRAASPVDGAVIACYAETLYRAFAGQEGEERQRAAYTELLRYIYRVTHRYAPELAPDEREEIAHTVVAELYYRMVPAQGVRIPGAFIAIALQQTRNALRRWRGAARHILPPIEERAEPGESADDPADDVRGGRWAEDELYLSTAQREQTEQVRTAFSRTMQRHPRAKIQLLVVWLHVVEGVDYQTIAANLGISIANARVLYSRGRSRLRDDADLQALAAEERLTDVPGPLVPAAQRARVRGGQERS
jgi:DNA-directed RNA polymerase specialized sigma24 family protein